MREIKFRVWTGTQMEYRVVVGILGAFYVEGIDPSDSACMSPFNTRYDEQTPIMQFTGLYDRNGKEIYEGDILLLANGITVPVYYDSGAFWAGAVLLLTEDKSSVVIGNKWENPELDPDQ